MRGRDPYPDAPSHGTAPCAYRRTPPGAVIATLPQSLNALIHGTFPADLFHPNELGYRDWTSAFADVLGLERLVRRAAPQRTRAPRS